MPHNQLDCRFKAAPHESYILSEYRPATLAEPRRLEASHKIRLLFYDVQPESKVIIGAIEDIGFS